MEGCKDTAGPRYSYVGQVKRRSRATALCLSLVLLLLCAHPATACRPCVGEVATNLRTGWRQLLQQQPGLNPNGAAAAAAASAVDPRQTAPAPSPAAAPLPAPALGPAAPSSTPSAPPPYSGPSIVGNQDMLFIGAIVLGTISVALLTGCSMAHVRAANRTAAATLAANEINSRERRMVEIVETKPKHIPIMVVMPDKQIQYTFRQVEAEQEQPPAADTKAAEAAGTAAADEAQQAGAPPAGSSEQLQQSGLGREPGSSRSGRKKRRKIRTMPAFLEWDLSAALAQWSSRNLDDEASTSGSSDAPPAGILHTIATSLNRLSGRPPSQSLPTNSESSRGPGADSEPQAPADLLAGPESTSIAVADNEASTTDGTSAHTSHAQ